MFSWIMTSFGMFGFSFFQCFHSLLGHKIYRHIEWDSLLFLFIGIYLCLFLWSIQSGLQWYSNKYVSLHNTHMVHTYHIEANTNGHHFADDIFKCIFLNENVWNQIKISLKFVPKGPINNVPAMVQIMAWRRPGDKPLSEPKVVSLPTHICVVSMKPIFAFTDGKEGCDRPISIDNVEFLPYLRKDFIYLSHINVEEWHKMQI